MKSVKAAKRKTDNESNDNSKAKKREIDYSKQTKQQLIVLLETVCVELEKSENENKGNLVKINMLEEKIKSLQKKSQSSKSASVQTDNVDGMLCIECEYPAEDIFDLGEHMYEIHAEANEEYNESCHYCTQLFKTKRDVMLHSKKWHKEKVKPCRNFLRGQCDYTEIEC